MDPSTEPWNWQYLLWHVVQVLIYVGIGLGLFAVAYLIIDKLTPFSLYKEINQEKNVALAVVLGSVFLGIALILAAAIRG
jgi:uncharacterized membrane protein YjfL (UPF0719 family)